MAKFIDKQGLQTEADLGIHTIREAQEKKVGVRQLINQKYETPVGEAEAFTQLCASENLYFGRDELMGLNPQNISSLQSILEPQAANTADAVPASRILFPPALLAAIDADLPLDRTNPVDKFKEMVAFTDTVNKARVERPLLNYKTPGGPEEFMSQRASQLAEPENMMLITASDIARKIPTYNMGVMVADEALEITTLPILAMTLRRQKEVEMFKRAGVSVNAMLNGDADHNTSALAQIKANTYDSTITTNGELTHKAWVEWLNHDTLRLAMDYVIVDSISTAMAIENRTGRPIVTDDKGTDGRIDTSLNIIYPNTQKEIKCFVAPKEWALPANTIMGIMSSYAIAGIKNSSAEYSASERFALRKAESFRYDFAEDHYRFYDDAFSVLSLTV